MARNHVHPRMPSKAQREKEDMDFAVERMVETAIKQDPRVKSIRKDLEVRFRSEAKRAIKGKF